MEFGFSFRFIQFTSRRFCLNNLLLRNDYLGFQALCIEYSDTMPVFVRMYVIYLLLLLLLFRYLIYDIWVIIGPVYSVYTEKYFWQTEWKRWLLIYLQYTTEDLYKPTKGFRLKKVGDRHQYSKESFPELVKVISIHFKGVI